MFRPILAAIFVLVQCATTYRILCVVPFPGKSHFDVFLPLFKALSERSHEVTVVSYFPQPLQTSTYKDVSLKNNTELYINKIQMDTFTNSKSERYLNIFALVQLAESTALPALSAETLKDFLEKKQKFDLVLAELFPSIEFAGMLTKIGAPFVVLSSSDLLPWFADYVGQPDNPAYVPTLLMDSCDSMTFFERVENSVGYVFHKGIFKLLMDIPANRLARKYFGADTPPLGVVLGNASLVLVNTYHVIHRPKPLVPGIIQVGGMHIGNVRKLSQNIEKWITESTHGVIYFSMGSMIKGHTFPEEKRKIFLRAFGRLKQRVLWKWENDTMPGKPDNVMIQKWMPQFDILCHPNVKAFISHGGLLGTTEAVHCGVPAVVMPQYGDQYTNARALEASGGGIILHFRTATEEDVYNALKTVLDPSFKKKTEELSERFRDRPMPPLETAIYWVEYVARHKGAHHLRTAAVGMPLYQYLLLDVIAFLLLVFLASVITFYYTMKFIITRLFKKQIKAKQN